ncbi:CHAT domain-containing protein [Azoarcus sp. L1K30]|uniref:CHAT domain-containing protein n=1 Tax=Azoarcus sp. L1K30 TaxID=2820277 RepID=UPI001B83A8CF|nr:CHAT domain-containing protein [Azoarcus sp. L1K30]MBR0565110.1 CHAT domain-containing protein [Azoarcus sp. L1K30]
MPYPAHLGQRPLEVLEAYAALEQFANDYGEEALLLLMHASIPETLRADLLDLIRVNFLSARNADRSLEADVLFAPLTTALGGGFYRVDPQVRWHCMALLHSRYRDDTRPRALRVAELLWCYVDAAEKRAGGAIDPQMAEFLAIQRWVALAFIDPGAAAHAFADALGQFGSGPVAARLQLGGLAAAIEMPLAREQSLLAYARGMNALARGDDDNGRRILGALGNEEIRVGDVVLRPASALLSEAGMASPDTPPMADRPVTPDARQRCVVLIGTGARTALGGGPAFDADFSFALIRAALAGAGFDCERASALAARDRQGEALYAALFAADLVVADLSSPEPGLCFLLGICLALRPAGTAVIVADGSAEAAFTIAPGLHHRYRAVPPGDREAEEGFAALLRSIASGDTLPLARSPLYLDTALAPPQMLDAADAAQVAQAPYAADDGRCLIVRAAAPLTALDSARMAALNTASGIAEACASEAGLQPHRPDLDTTGSASPATLIAGAGLAIFDISEQQPDTLLQLGMRLGLMPGRCIVIAEARTPLPLELADLPLLRYPTPLGTREADDLHSRLFAQIKHLAAGTAVVSPVYVALPRLRPPRTLAAATPHPSRRTLIVRQHGPGNLQYHSVAGERSNDWTVRYQPAVIENLMRQFSSTTDASAAIAWNLAQLILPVELGDTPPGGSEHLLLNHDTAALPWEAILAARGGGTMTPIAITRSLDGQLQATRARSTSRHALLIGNPLTTQTLPDMAEGFPPLEGVWSELQAVSRTLMSAGYAVTVSERENAAEIIGKLFSRDFEIMLVSGNAVHEYPLGNGRTVSGFVLSDGVFLSATEFAQMRKPPRLVFLNGCHAGYQTDPGSGATETGHGVKTSGSTSMVGELLRMGVDCVLAPAWAVSDEGASIWSQRLFEQLANGADLETASLAARVAALERAPNETTWAAYQVWGDPDFRLTQPATAS